MKITVSATVAAPIEAVWQAYTTPADIQQWNAASDDWHTPTASVDLRVGGSFSFRMEARDGSMGFDFAGVYTEIEPCSRLVYAFGERSASITFSNSPTGVNVSICFDSENTHSIAQQEQGWQAILTRIARYVEARAA